MDNLIIKWKEAKRALEPPSQTAEQLIEIARQKKKKVLYFHYGNIVILSVTMIIISFFFYVTPFNYLLSKIGISLMLVGLGLRIIIEVHSSIKSKIIQWGKDAFQTTQDAFKFYSYRKKIHGPFTFLTVGLYVLGFYLLSPEFSTYIILEWLIIMHISFIVGAVFLSWQIRKGIKKEMNNLSNLIALKKEVNGL